MYVTWVMSVDAFLADFVWTEDVTTGRVTLEVE